MNVKILSELSAIEYVAGDIPPTCIISITNPGRENICFKNPNIIDILHVKFADSLYQGRMSEENANAIIEFLIKNKNYENFMVHCKAGQSRSAAVGAVILDLFNNDDSQVWNNPYMMPNRWCYYLLKLQIEMKVRGIKYNSIPFDSNAIRNLEFSNEILNWCYINLPQYSGYGLLLEPNDEKSVRLNDGLYGTGFSEKIKAIRKNQLFILPSMKKRKGDF